MFPLHSHPQGSTGSGTFFFPFFLFWCQNESPYFFHHNTKISASNSLYFGSYSRKCIPVPVSGISILIFLCSFDNSLIPSVTFLFLPWRENKKQPGGKIIQNVSMGSRLKIHMSKLTHPALKGHWTSIISSPKFLKKVVIFIPLKLLAWVMTASWVSRSRLTYFWMNMSSIFYFSKSTSINTQYGSLWDTLKMMLFTKYIINENALAELAENFGVGLIQNHLSN